MIPLALKALGFLKGLPWQVYAAIGALALCVGGWRLHVHAADEQWRTAYRAGTDAASVAFSRAQAEADRQASIGVVQTVTKQQAIAAEKSNALEKVDTDIDARAHAISVRHAAASGQRALGAGDPRPAGEAASQPCPAPAEDGLAWDVALAALTQAAKNDAQLNAILDFEEAQDALAASEDAKLASSKAH